MVPSQSLQLLLLFFLSVVVQVQVHCGDAPDPPQTRIVGGADIDIEKAPWMAIFEIHLYGEEKTWCAGTIISSRWILTAAHCTFRHHHTQMEVLIGTKTRNSTNQRYKVETVVVHEEYDNNITYNDISLIKTATDMALDNKTMKAVDLPTADMKRPEVNTPLTITGWGRTKYNGQLMDSLQAVDVVMNDFKDCNFYPHLDESKQICVGLSWKGSCMGDSGGPVVMNSMQVGIVSYGSKLCGPRPSIFTYVAAYRDWIKSKTGF